MREFKFRAWDPVNKIFPFVGFDILGETTVFDVCRQYMLEHALQLEITQYTGLKDKNGVEIYEGDIVKTDFNKYGSHNSIQVIEFWQGAFGSRNKEDHFRIPALFSGRATEGMTLNYYEVIGNIYEHQELLSDKK